MEDDKFGKYPMTGTYKVIDSIGVPHPYCITAKHVCHASDNYGGLLGSDAIEDAERHGATCGICKGQLSFKQHEKALLIQVRFGGELKDAPELKEYLLSIKEMATHDGYAGFAFKQVKS